MQLVREPKLFSILYNSLREKTKWQGRDKRTSHMFPATPGINGWQACAAPSCCIVANSWWNYMTILEKVYPILELNIWTVGDFLLERLGTET